VFVAVYRLENRDLRAAFTTLGMLTFPLNLLSNPDQPLKELSTKLHKLCHKVNPDKMHLLPFFFLILPKFLLLPVFFKFVFYEH